MMIRQCKASHTHSKCSESHTNRKCNVFHTHSKCNDSHTHKHVRLATLASALAALTLSSQVMAAPRNMLPVLDHAVNAGLTTTPAGTTMQITGKGNNALMVWKEFNVGKGASVTFSADKGQAMSFLNVVKGPGASYIDGRIAANKNNINVYLINPNGIHLSNTSKILNFNKVYLGTNKPSQELMDKFKQAALPPINLDAMPSDRGMGKVVALNTIEASDIKINAGHIVIGSIDNTLSKNTLPKSLELNSSIDRIDIGGDLDKKHVAGGKSYREFLKDNGYSAATTNEIKSSGTLKKNTYVDHSKEIAIYEADQLDRINQNLDKNFWLADDIIVNDHIPLGKDQGKAFSGSFDGAFNSITYSMQADKAGDYGLFGKLDGASVKNLKIVNSNVDTDAKVAGQKLNIGALSGSAKDSDIINVEISNFDVLLDDANRIDNKSSIGALVGSMEGNNSLNNVLSSYNSDAEEAIDNAKQQGFLVNAGTLIGSHSGTLNKHNVVVGAHSFNNSSLQGIGQSNNGRFVATTFADAAKEAINSGMSVDEFYESYAVDGSIDEPSLKLKHKTFLKPFYVEDFNFTYDGTKHDYHQLVNNEGFELDNLVTKTNQTNFTQQNAGNHVFELTTRKESLDNGHDYFFSYKYADESWDSNAGGDAALQDRTSRHDSASGKATLNINKKKLVVDIANQVVADGKQPNLKPGKDTINNYDDLINIGLVKGDKFDDLNLSLTLRPDGTIVGTSHSNNYEVAINNGTLTVIKPPKPVPTPNPGENIKPNPQIPPKVENLKQTDTLPEIAKCSHCGEIGSYKGVASQTVLPSRGHLVTGVNDYSDSIYAALENTELSNDSEFNAYVIAHHNQTINGDDNAKLFASNNTVKAKKQTDAKGANLLASSQQTKNNTASGAGDNKNIDKDNEQDTFAQNRDSSLEKLLLANN